MIKLKKEVETEMEMSPEDACEILEMADEIRANPELMKEVLAYREGEKKPKSIEDLKKLEKEMPDEEE